MYVFEIRFYSLGGVVALVLLVLLVDKVEAKVKYSSIVNICFVIFYLTCRCSNRACCLGCCCCSYNNQFFMVFIKLYKVDCKRMRIQVIETESLCQSVHTIFFIIEIVLLTCCSCRCTSRR
jgi:hypothetical protein